MRPSWGKLINAALDAGLDREDALLAVLQAARTLEQGCPDELPRYVRLTPAEVRALETFARIDDFADVVAELGVTRHTVNQQTKNARRKLGVHTTTEAVDRALELGLIEVPEAVAA